MARPTVAVIGAAGEMARTAIATIAARQDVDLVLSDVNVDALQGSRPAAGGDVRLARVDLYDYARLREFIRGASLVVLGAGPFMRTSAPVISACIDEGIDYLDFCDDTAGVRAAQEQGQRAEAAGVACYTGCGIAPGMSNLMAADAADRLDEVDTIDIGWVIGDEGPHAYGAAVIEHWMHCCAGECRMWRDGREVVVDGFVDTEVFDMGGRLGPHRLYQTDHPEAVTLGARYPAARRIRVMGGLDPQPVNGLSRGLALAVLDGRATMQEAVGFFQDVQADRTGDLRLWRHALGGLAGQLRRGEVSAADTARFAGSALRKQHPPFVCGFLARATGRKDGRPASVVHRTPAAGAETTFWRSMAACTGISTAAFVSLALADAGRRAGVFVPEAWTTLARWRSALVAAGVPEHEILADGPAPIGRHAVAQEVSPR